MKTRSTKKSPANTTESPDDQVNDAPTLEPSTNNPPLLFVLPEGVSTEARIVTFPNPATSAPTRYFFCPEKGIHEFTRIAAPKKAPRSWLIAPAQPHADISDEHSIVSDGYSVENADLYVATPCDPLFILLPALIPAPDSHEQLFQNIDDHLDVLSERSKHLNQLLRSTKIQQLFEKRANAVCDNVDMGHEKLYRLSNQKLLAELVKKARRMVANGLPPSLENHFVQEALRMPMTAVQRSNSQDEATPTPQLIDSAQPSQVSVPSTPAPSTPDNIVSLLRLRTSLDLILSTYIPSTLHTPLRTLLSSSSSPVDFAPLDAYLEQIAKAKREAHTLRSLSDNISRKRSGFNDEEAEEKQAEKRRKKEEEEAKKKNTSRGVKQLSKADTSGMKKLSSFFTKAPAKK